MDTASLAQALVDAQKAPQKDLINTQITRTEARISGYGAMKYALGELRTAFEKLNDASDFGTPKAVVNQPGAFGATAGANASAGSYSVEVTQLARAQRLASGGFTGTTASLNNGQPFDLSVAINGATARTIAVATDTPEGMAAAINGAGLGLSAQLINTGETGAPYKLVISGQEGAANAFTLSSAVAGVNFGTPLTTAANATLKVNGLPVTRASNSITDVIPGVTLDLQATTTGAARLDLTRDTASAKANIQSLVDAYNTFDTSMQILGDSKSDVETLGGSLSGVSLLRSVRSQIRNLLSGTSSTASGTIQAARDVGLSLDRYGKLTLDEAKLDAALKDHPGDVAKMFSAGTSNKSLYNPSPAGLAGDMVVAIDKLQRSTGIISQQTDQANKDLSKQKAKLTALEDRMTKLLDQYTKQFSAMDSVVGNASSLKTSLSSSFEAMLKSYSN